jgi:anti-sigma factor RsiW
MNTEMDMERVRQFVDGELPPQGAAEFERALATDEDLRNLVAFEQSLRVNVARQMQASVPAAPLALRSAVREAIAATRPHPVSAADADTGVIARIFAGPRRANVFAVAACLLIVAGSVIVGLFGDEWGFGLRGPVSGSSSEVRVDVMAITAQHAGREHGRCMSNADALNMKMHYRDSEEIQSNLSGRLGVRVPIFDLSGIGLDLVGGGECSLGPLPRSTVHLMYRDRAGRGGLSVFLQPNRGQYGEMENFLETGMVYMPKDLPDCGGESTCMLTDGRIVYIIRACDPGVQDAATGAVLRAITARN